MPDRLFLNSVHLEGGRVMFGFAAGEPVALDEAEKLRDLPGGLSEYSVKAADGDDRLEIRALVDGDAQVLKVIACAGPISDSWYERTSA